MLLLELFNRKLEYKQTDDHANYQTYRFNVGQDVILVTIARADDYDDNPDLDMWEVSFGRKKVNDKGTTYYDYSKTESGKTDIRTTDLIFSTVLEIVGQFVSRKDPRFLTFTSDNGEPSRTKLYDRMVRRLSSTFGYTHLDLKADDFDDPAELDKKYGLSDLDAYNLSDVLASNDGFYKTYLLMRK